MRTAERVVYTLLHQPLTIALQMAPVLPRTRYEAVEALEIPSAQPPDRQSTARPTSR